MMPMHPAHRDPAETLQEDREAVILADKLGFHDAFVGEHLTDRCENVTNSFIFLATLIAETRTIKLGTGTSNLSHAHPTLIAAHAAMFDHLAKGRFIFGISPGALASDAEALGMPLPMEERNKLFAEAIDVILAIWERDAPYDIDLPGNRFKVSTAKTLLPELGRGFMYKPYQKPRPEIVGTVVAPHSKGVIAMGERDFHPMSANFLLPHWLASHWANYSTGKQNVGQKANPADWRVARTIFVADDDKTAERAPRHLQAARAGGRRRGHARAAARPARHLRQRQPGRGPDPRAARAGGRLRRAGLRRHGLGRPPAGEAFHGADGGKSHAAARPCDGFQTISGDMT